MRKGFTLIELLAVIVLLAVIALISTPLIIDVVQRAEEQGRLESVHGIMEAAKLYYSESMLNDDLSLEGNLYNTLVERVKGDKPESGEFYLDDDNSTSLAIKYDENCYVKSFYDNDVFVVKSEECSVKTTAAACFDYKKVLDYDIVDVDYDTCVANFSSSDRYSESEIEYLCTGKIEEAMWSTGSDYHSLQNFGLITNLRETNKIKITGFNCFVGNKDGLQQMRDIEIPSSIDGFEVVSIDRNAFSSKTLTSVSFPSTLVSIGNDAFWNNQLTSIEFPQSLEIIGEYALSFNYLEDLDLTSLTNLKSIGSNAFKANEITNIKIPNNVITIGKNAFSSERGVTHMIGTEITKLFNYRDNPNLSSITIDNVEGAIKGSPWGAQYATINYLRTE